MQISSMSLVHIMSSEKDLQSILSATKFCPTNFFVVLCGPRIAGNLYSICCTTSPEYGDIVLTKSRPLPNIQAVQNILATEFLNRGGK